jgi:hypothetical protein
MELTSTTNLGYWTSWNDHIHNPRKSSNHIIISTLTTTSKLEGVGRANIKYYRLIKPKDCISTCWQLAITTKFNNIGRDSTNDDLTRFKTSTQCFFKFDSSTKDIAQNQIETNKQKEERKV